MLLATRKDPARISAITAGGWQPSRQPAADLRSMSSAVYGVTMEFGALTWETIYVNRDKERVCLVTLPFLTRR